MACGCNAQKARVAEAKRKQTQRNQAYQKQLLVKRTKRVDEMRARDIHRVA